MKNIAPVALSAGLYIVATPIGNLRDITLRALDVLAAVDLVVCEDTRVTGKLLKAFSIEKKMIPYNDHNAARQRGSILEVIGNGGRVALVSDAGMPLVSDPGFKLVRDCLDLGFMVTSLPGANAPLTALQLSGLPSDKFCFLGFLPVKSEGRRNVLREWAGVGASLVIFESGPRLVDSLADMLGVLGDRPAAVVREITKMYEESRRDTLHNLLTHYEEDGAPRGEIVVVVGAGQAPRFSEGDLRALLAAALAGDKGVKEAAAEVGAQTGESKKMLYEMALGLKKREDGDEQD